MSHSGYWVSMSHGNYMNVGKEETHSFLGGQVSAVSSEPPEHAELDWRTFLYGAVGGHTFESLQVRHSATDLPRRLSELLRECAQRGAPAGHRHVRAHDLVFLCTPLWQRSEGRLEVSKEPVSESLEPTICIPASHAT